MGLEFGARPDKRLRCLKCDWTGIYASRSKIAALKSLAEFYQRLDLGTYLQEWVQSGVGGLLLEKMTAWYPIMKQLSPHMYCTETQGA